MRTSFAWPANATGALLASLLLAACSGASSFTGSPVPTGSAIASASTSASLPPTPDAAPPTSEAPSVAPSAEPTSDLGPFACSFPVEGSGTVSLAHVTDVRVGEHDGYDRIVFEFDAGIPAYAISEATPPFTRDPSGLPMTVDGSSFWEVVLTNGTKQLDDGTSSYTGSTDLAPGFAKLVELVERGDFEGVSSWYVGMSGSSCVRVLTLADPARLVIDIER